MPVFSIRGTFSIRRKGLPSCVFCIYPIRTGIFLAAHLPSQRQQASGFGVHEAVERDHLSVR